MRNCIINDAKKIARKVVKNLLIEGVESIVQENVNSVSINTLDTFNLNQAIDLSKTIISEINNEYNSSKFGELASLNTSIKNKVSINLHPTARLIKAQEMLRDNKVDIEELNSLEITSSTPEIIDTNRLEQINDIFQEFTVLQSIGSQKDYNKYLDTIFPNSKVKDIVYHTTPYQFDKFDKRFIGKGIGNTTEGVGFYFSNRKKHNSDI